MSRRSNQGDARESKELALLRAEVERLRALVPACRRMPKLLVLDLNGFLVHRVFVGDGAAADGALPSVPHNWTLNNFLVFERPHARAFLRFCLDNFFVGVWTTASTANATALIDGLLDPADAAKLAFLWDGKRCTYNGETDPLKPGKPIAFKELRRLWESRDLAGGMFGPENTLLIDDSTYKASLNPEHTAIHPPAWDDPEALAGDAELSPTGKIRGYLEALLRSELSVPEFVRSRPFESFGVAHEETAGKPALQQIFSLADLEARRAPATAAAAASSLAGAVGSTITTPEVDFHRPGQARNEVEAAEEEEQEEQEEEDDDEIVLAPSLAGLSLRPA